MLVTLSLPSLIQGFGWILLLNPSNGYINILLRDWLPFDIVSGPFNIYSLGMMVTVSSFLLTHTIYVMLSGIIRNMDYKLYFPDSLARVMNFIIYFITIVQTLLLGYSLHFIVSFV